MRRAVPAGLHGPTRRDHGPSGGLNRAAAALPPSLPARPRPASGGRPPRRRMGADGGDGTHCAGSRVQDGGGKRPSGWIRDFRQDEHFRGRGQRPPRAPPAPTAALRRSGPRPGRASRGRAAGTPRCGAGTPAERELGPRRVRSGDAITTGPGPGRGEAGTPGAEGTPWARPRVPGRARDTEQAPRLLPTATERGHGPLPPRHATGRRYTGDQRRLMVFV